MISKPMGQTQHGYSWCNAQTGTTRAVTCEICGTAFLERAHGDDLHLANFLGRQVVLECCGKIIDLAYDEMGESFATEFLDDYANDPTNIRFGTFRYAISGCVQKAKEVIVKALRDIKTIEKNL